MRREPLQSLSFPVLVGIVLITLVGASRGNSQVATFESFPEGVVGHGSFLDPASGILFTNGPGAVFTVDYFGRTLPPFLPSNLLGGNNWSPGGSASFTAGFGFTCVLPSPSTHVQMDAIYVGASFGFLMGVTGYATNGQQVLSTNITLPSSLNANVAHCMCVSAVPMKRVVVTTPPYVGVSFDNIGAPPVIEQVFQTNQILVLTVQYGRPESLLLCSTNLTTWSLISAQVTTNDSGSMTFTVLASDPWAFYRVRQ
jgi:hypothetical protein